MLGSDGRMKYEDYNYRIIEEFLKTYSEAQEYYLRTGIDNTMTNRFQVYAVDCSYINEEGYHVIQKWYYKDYFVAELVNMGGQNVLFHR